MAHDRRLRRWVDAGLISSAQAEAIGRHEDDRRGPALVRSIAVLAGLAIGIGLLSIVAANWESIPGRVKIGIDLLLLVITGVGVVRLSEHADRPRWAVETAIVVLYILVLASIGLVGQVYQLGGQPHHALLAWVVLTGFLMSRAHSDQAGFAWLAGLQLTWLAWCVWLMDDAAFGSQFTESLGIGAVGWAPMVTLAAARSPWVRARRPEFAATFERVAWAEIVLGGTIGTFAFYEDMASELGAGMTVAAGVAAGLGLLAAWWGNRGPSPARARGRALLAASIACAYVPAIVSPGDLDLLAALAFIGLWLLVARHAHAAGDSRTLNAATGMVGLRLIIVYFEVFGSLLDTGLGLMGGGVITLGLIWLWARKRREFETELADTPLDRADGGESS